MPEHHGGDMGGTMRLGSRRTCFNVQNDSKLFHLYGRKNEIDERHRHRYEVNPDFVGEFESHGMRFVGKSADSGGARMEIMELADHPYFVGIQYHPEYLTRPLTPSPPYVGLLLAACGKLDLFLQASRSASPVGADFVVNNNADVDVKDGKAAIAAGGSGSDLSSLAGDSQNSNKTNPAVGITGVRHLLNQIKSFAGDPDIPLYVDADELLEVGEGSDDGAAKQ